MSFDFSVLIASNNFLISFFERIVGRCFSFFGLLIVVVGSFWKIDWWAYFIAARKRMIDDADLSVKFSAMNCFMSSLFISFGDLFVDSIKF